MGRVRARDLGFDACMYMLHKTFGVPKGGGGPAVGAFGCTEELTRFLPAPVVVRDGDRFRLDHDRPDSVGKVREFWGNVQQVVKAYLWSRAMGAEGIKEAADLSVLANNYMDKRILEIPGITRSNAQLDVPRMEMTRFSLGDLQRETGIGVVDVANRLADYGIDGPWESHEPWIVPEPITPEAGEMWSKEDLDYWIDALAQVCREAREDPELVRTAPHNQVVHKLADVPLDDPDYWATTWRAYGASTHRWPRRCERSHRPRHGASKGIGAEVVAALGRAGAHVVAHYGSDRAGAEAATAEIPDERKLLVGADLFDPAETATRLWETATAWRPVDVLVNNAAVMEQVPFDGAARGVARRLGARVPDQRPRDGRPDPRRRRALRRARRRRDRDHVVLGRPARPRQHLVRRLRRVEGSGQGPDPDGGAPLRLPGRARLRAGARRRADAALGAGGGALRRRGGRALDPRDERDGAAVRPRRARFSSWPPAAPAI